MVPLIDAKRIEDHAAANFPYNERPANFLINQDKDYPACDKPHFITIMKHLRSDSYSKKIVYFARYANEISIMPSTLYVCAH